jgi:uroporphyrin-III C-methyltransferase
MNQKTDDPTDSSEPRDQPTDEPEAAQDDESVRQTDDGVPGHVDETARDVEPAADAEPIEPGPDVESAGIEREPLADEPAGGEPETRHAVAPPRSRASAAIAWFAALLAVAALAGVGWLAWQGRDSGAEAAANAVELERLASQFAGLSEELGETAGGLRELRESFGQFAAGRTEVAAEIDSLRGRLEGLLERSESLAPRIAELENAVSSLQGISTGAREAWLLAEAEYYMQIANARLQLAHSPEIALLALNYADERIRQLADPGLTEVRRALSREIQALEAHERLDVEGIALALANLAERVDSLPLDERVAEPRQEPEAIDDESSGASRAWESVKQAFSGLVSVRRAEEDVRPLLSPEAAYFLRANLALQFQSARLALLRGELAIYSRSLADAADWLGRYYDADSRAVRQAIETIGEIRDRPVQEPLPDISESLRLLRQYRSRRDMQAGTRAAGEPGR